MKHELTIVYEDAIFDDGWTYFGFIEGRCSCDMTFTNMNEAAAHYNTEDCCVVRKT